MRLKEDKVRRMKCIEDVAFGFSDYSITPMTDFNRRAFDVFAQLREGVTDAYKSFEDAKINNSKRFIMPNANHKELSRLKKDALNKAKRKKYVYHAAIKGMGFPKKEYSDLWVAKEENRIADDIIKMYSEMLIQKLSMSTDPVDFNAYQSMYMILNGAVLD